MWIVKDIIHGKKRKRRLNWKLKCEKQIRNNPGNERKRE